jgi:hypothetical protein
VRHRVAPIGGGEVADACVGSAWFDHQSFILFGGVLREGRYFKALNKEIL